MARVITVRPYYAPTWGGYYAYPIFEYGDAYQNDSEPADVESQDEYRRGPTIFDRRGDGQYPRPGTAHRSEPISEPVSEAIEETLESNPSPAPQPVAVADQPQTVLVFKDGHEANVDNYAIVGNTLYDFTGGMRHKIALADLDLRTTAQQNDERGVDFQLPGGSASN